MSFQKAVLLTGKIHALERIAKERLINAHSWTEVLSYLNTDDLEEILSLYEESKVISPQLIDEYRKALVDDK